MDLNIPEKIYDRVRLSASGKTVTLTGEIDQLNPGLFLKPFFDKVLEQMGSVVYIDIRNLKYLNSASIRCLVSFLIDRKPDTKVVLVVNRNFLWQMNSLDVIQEIDKINIAIKEE